MNKVIKIVSYTIFALFSLLVFVYLTFPTGTLGSVIKAQGEAALGFKYQVSIEDVSLAGLTGLELENVLVTPIEATVTEAEADDNLRDTGPPVIAIPMVIERVVVTGNPISLILGDPSVSFEANIGGGQIDGSWKPDDELEGGHVLQVNIRNVPVLSLGWVLNTLQAPFTGNITGFIEVHMDSQGVIQGGMIKVALANLIRGPGYQPLGQEYFVTFLTPTRFGDLWLDTSLEEATADLTLSNGPPEDNDIASMIGSATGQPDIEVFLDGRLNLRTPFSQSLSRLVLQLGLAGTWIDENDFGGPLRNIPLLRQSCSDNQCAMTLSGPLAQARPQPFRRGR